MASSINISVSLWFKLEFIENSANLNNCSGYDFDIFCSFLIIFFLCFSVIFVFSIFFLLFGFFPLFRFFTFFHFFIFFSFFLYCLGFFRYFVLFPLFHAFSWQILHLFLTKRCSRDYGLSAFSMRQHCVEIKKKFCPKMLKQHVFLLLKQYALDTIQLPCVIQYARFGSRFFASFYTC